MLRFKPQIITVLGTERFETDKTVKLIEFSIKNKKFMPKEAMNASGLVSLEFA
jgi:hypothetical protein